MDHQAKYVRDRISEYLGAITNLSAGNPPPGANATNGHFREAMLDSYSIVRCGERNDDSERELTGDASALLRIHIFFYGAIQRAFRDNPNYQAAAGDVIRANVGRFQGELTVLTAAIVADIVTDGGASPAVDAAARNLVGSVAAKGFVTNGAHANGHISLYVHDAAQWTSERINDHFGSPRPPADTDVRRVVQVLDRILGQLYRLPVDGHNPWLTASWQIEFETIMRAGSAQLDSLP